MFSLGADAMSATTAKRPGKGRRLRVTLYVVGILVAITVAGLARTSPTHTAAIHRSGRATASLTDVNALTIAPIADQSTNIGMPATPISPTIAFTQPTPGTVVIWAGEGLPPGISISTGSGLVSGTPTTAGAYSVTVEASADTRPPLAASQSFSWQVVDTAPRVTSVTPATGAGGTRAVIAGKNLRGVTSVHFGSVPVPSFVVNKRGTAIIVHVPATRPGVVNVRLTSAIGTAPPVTADRFTYVVPTITAVSRHTGPISGGTRVRITGTGLAGATAVRFGTVPSRQFAVHHNGKVVTAVAPAGAVGTVAIEIVTPGGIVSTRGSEGFAYLAPT